MDNTLTILIVGYDKDSDIWPLSNFMWKENWPDCSFRTIFVSVDKKNENSPYNLNITSSGKEAYSERLLAALKEVESEYVLLLLHDYGLSEKPNDKFLLKCCDFMKTFGYRFCQLGTQYKNKIRKSIKIKNTEFSRMKKNRLYRISLQPAIWKKDYLVEVCSAINMDSAFDFEAFLNQRIGKELSTEKACFPSNYNFPMIDLLEKGKLSYLASEYIKKHNCDFKCSREEQNESHFRKGIRRMKLYELMPTFLLKFLSKVRKNKSFMNRATENNDKTIIISGANGFLGSLLVKKFFQNGFKVVSLLEENNNQNIEDIKKYSYRIIRTNFNDCSKQIELPKESVGFIHLAWAGVNGNFKGDEKTQKNNMLMALNAAAMANYSHAKKFIGIGTITELAYLHRDNDNLSPSLVYGKYKYLCYKELEKYFSKEPVQFMWLRLSNLYGITNKTGNILSYEISSLLNGEEPKFGPCDQYYDFLLVDDAIEAIFRFINLKQNFNNLYFIGSKEPRILSEYLLFIDKCITGGGKIRIGERGADGMIFKKEFFDSSETFSAIGNYVSDTFDNNMLKLIHSLKSNNNL